MKKPTDTQMLDWLQKEQAVVGRLNGTHTRVCWGDTDDPFHIERRGYRAAIRAAMKAERPTKPKRRKP